ncbi:MAG: glycosyltransferase [Candidatus Binatia bacterium]
MAEKMESICSEPRSRTQKPDPSCAVVVASFRPGPLIYLCLRSLLAQEGVPSPEIIVVDSSGDGTAAQLRASFPTITVIELLHQTPQAAARNLGVACSRAQFIAFTDQDCIVPPDWLLQFIAWHNRDNYDAVGGAIGNGTPESAVGTASYLIEFNEFLPTGAPGFAEMIPHCNICFRREVFTTVGPFFEVPSGAEDLLYNFFICQNGGRLLCDPNIVVTHINRTDFSDFLQHQWVLGFGSAVARRSATLKGQPFVRYPFLSYMLPFVRLVRTFSRLLRHNRPVLRQYLQLLPLLIPGYCRWTSGFLAGVRSDASEPGFRPALSSAHGSAGIETVQSETHVS